LPKTTTADAIEEEVGASVDVNQVETDGEYQMAGVWVFKLRVDDVH